MNLDDIEAERDEARFELDSYRRRIRISTVATRQGFKDPEDAHAFLADDETEDEQSTERALKRLARQKPYLVNKPRSSGVAVGSGGNGVGLTVEEIKSMTPDQINARWDEVQKVMSGQGG